MAFNKLPLEFLDLNDMGTQSRGVSVLYGRRTDGSLVAVNVADDGTLSINSTVTINPGDIQIGAVEIKDSITDDRVRVLVVPTLPNAVVTTVNGSTNSFYVDNTITALTTLFALSSFGFTSKSITVINDSINVIDFSFDGVNVHGKLRNGEATTMDHRAQTGIYLKSNIAGSNYRAWSY